MVRTVPELVKGLTMSTLPTEPFWMVHAIGGGAPTYPHDSRISAETEAKRPARKAPGTVFVVLEAVGAVVKDDLQTITFRAAPLDDRDIPF